MRMLLRGISLMNTHLKLILSALMGAFIMFECLRIHESLKIDPSPSYVCLNGKVYQSIEPNLYTKTNIECIIRDTIGNE